MHTYMTLEKKKKTHTFESFHCWDGLINRLIDTFNDANVRTSDRNNGVINFNGADIYIYVSFMDTSIDVQSKISV